jgi:phosphoserine aminotransferase
MPEKKRTFLASVALLIFGINYTMKTQLQRRTLYFTARSFEKSAKAILNFNDSGLSILEISHRSKDFLR